MRRAGDPRAGQRTGPEAAPPLNIATALTDISERVAVLVREEVELAKAEVAEKASRLARGAVVGVVAGIFFLTALFFVLIGCAWLLYYYLPVAPTSPTSGASSRWPSSWSCSAPSPGCSPPGALKTAPRRCPPWRSRRRV